MRHLLTLLAALMLVTVTGTIPAQAQHQVERPRYRTPPKPQAFTRQFKARASRSARVSPRATVARPGAVQPRFYHSKAASRKAQRMRNRTQGRLQNRARANVSPGRRHQPRFYSTSSAARTSQRIRRIQRRHTQAHRHAPTRTKPTFWK